MSKEELIEIVESDLNYLDKTCLNDFIERRMVNEVVYDLEITLNRVYEYLTGKDFEPDESNFSLGRLEDKMEYILEVHTFHLFKVLYSDKGITLLNPTKSLEGNLGFVNEINGEHIFIPIVYSGKSITKSFIKQMTRIHKEIFKCSPNFQGFK